jgi:hypothetical protein
MNCLPGLHQKAVSSLAPTVVTVDSSSIANCRTSMVCPMELISTYLSTTMATFVRWKGGSALTTMTPKLKSW